MCHLTLRSDLCSVSNRTLNHRTQFISTPACLFNVLTLTLVHLILHIITSSQCLSSLSPSINFNHFTQDLKSHSFRKSFSPQSSSLTVLQETGLEPAYRLFRSFIILFVIFFGHVCQTKLISGHELLTL